MTKSIVSASPRPGFALQPFFSLLLKWTPEHAEKLHKASNWNSKRFKFFTPSFCSYFILIISEKHKQFDKKKKWDFYAVFDFLFWHLVNDFFSPFFFFWSKAKKFYELWLRVKIKRKSEVFQAFQDFEIHKSVRKVEFCLLCFSFDGDLLMQSSSKSRKQNVRQFLV